MPKKKKNWIDKKTAGTYLVIHRNQNFPQLSEVQEEESASKKKDYEEHIKCGIYFNDDYDYMQHLRDLNEVVVLEKTEKVTAPHLSVNHEEIECGSRDDKLLSGDNLVDADDKFDSEIEAALNGNFDFDNPENQLEDNFVICANDGILPSAGLKHTQLDYRSRIKSFNEDDEEGSSSAGDKSSLELNGLDTLDNDEDGPIEEMTSERERTDHRFIDEQFEHLCNDYGVDQDSDAEDEEEADTLIDPNSNRIKELVEEHKRNKTEFVLHNDEVTKRFAERYEEESEDELEDVIMECSGPKKAKWDCESVLSTYSNIYNRPCLIEEPNRKHKLKQFLKKAEEDYAMEETRSKASFSLARFKNETKEEKQVRKALVKEQRRERRIEKKFNKLAFKEERRRMQAQQTRVNVKMAPLL